MIKNYTSDVPVFRTITRIEELLTRFGAKAIAKNYDGVRVKSLTFQLPIDGKDHIVQLPARPELVLEAMRRKKILPASWPIEKVRAQAERTAWKIQQDWLEIELTNLTLAQKDPLEIFMAYVWDGSQTYYEYIKGANFKQLGMGEKEAA